MQRFPSLEITSNSDNGKSTYNLIKPIINIGRDPLNDIVINASVISAFHAQVVLRDNRLVLLHPHPSQPQTTNGLLYQGRHIRGNESFSKPLVRGDVFSIGVEHGMMVMLTYNDGSGVPQKSMPESPPLPIGVPVSAIGSQSPHAQSPSQGMPQLADHQPPQSKKSRTKKFGPISVEEKAAHITAISAIIAAIITVVLGPLIATGYIPLLPGSNPTPSPKLTPVPSPSAYPPSGWISFLNDPMTSNNSGYWSMSNDQIGSCQFTDGAYQVSTSSVARACWLNAANDFTDFAIEVQIMMREGNEGAIFFRADGKTWNYYSFWISPDGTYGFEIWNNGKLDKSLGSGTFPSLKGFNRRNTVAIVAQENKFHLYINHQPIGVVPDPAGTYKDGSIALAAYALGSPTQALFSNVTVWKSPSS